MSERYKLTPIAPNPLAIDAAINTLEQSLPIAKALFQSGNTLASRPQTRRALDALLDLDRMECTSDYRVAHMALNMGDEPFIRDAFNKTLDDADNSGQSKRVLELVRVGTVLEIDSPPPPRSKIWGRFFPSRVNLTAAEITSRTQEAEAAARKFEELHQKHTELLARATTQKMPTPPPTPPPPPRTPTPPQAEPIIPTPPAPEPVTVPPIIEPQPARERPKRPRWKPEATEGKSSQWSGAQEKVSQLWEGVVQAKNLDTGSRGDDETKDRYDAALTIIRDRVQTPGSSLTGVEILAMVEFFVPRIWTQPDIPAKWYSGQFEGGRGIPLDLTGVKPAIKMTLLPERLRSASLPFSPKDTKEVDDFYKVLMLGIHHDRRSKIDDRNPQYDDAVAVLTKAATESRRILRPLMTRLK